MGQIQWTIALISLALFSVAVIGFMVGFANDNNSAIDIANDPQINTFSVDTNNNISSFQTGSQGTYDSIVNSTIDSGDTVTSGTPFAITPLNMVSVVSNIFKVGYTRITGGNPSLEIFLMTFLALIIFITAMYIWKTWGGRNPE